MKKWLDKYNDDIPQAQNGIEGTMGGLTDKGFNYNGAWGGPSMQNGGTRNKFKPIQQTYIDKTYVKSPVPLRTKLDDLRDARRSDEKTTKAFLNQYYNWAVNSMPFYHDLNKVDSSLIRSEYREKNRAEIDRIHNELNTGSIPVNTALKKYDTLWYRYGDTRDIRDPSLKALSEKEMANAYQQARRKPIIALNTPDTIVFHKGYVRGVDGLLGQHDPKKNITDVSDKDRLQTLIHERAHKADAPKRMKGTMDESLGDFVRTKNYDLNDDRYLDNEDLQYLRDFSERQARHRSTQYWLQKNMPGYNFKNPVNQKEYDFLIKNQDKLPIDVKQLLRLYGDRENFIKYFNRFQNGGSLPGAVGFMYARTQNPAPSNGPYAKKTKASAQNGKEMQYYQEGLDFKPKTISKNGGWLDKYEKAQVGKYIPSSTGDIASYYPAIKRMKEQPKMDQTKAEAKKREEQERSRKAIENQPTIGPAKPDYRTDREKAAQRNEMARREVMRNSALAQTMGSFTPSGSRDIGVIGAETFVNMNPLITGPFLSGTRLYGQASGQNPYGFGESTAGNVMGAVGMLGDAAFLRSAVPSGTASQLGRYITTETPVKNVYKINPFAEKLKDANKSYRVAGRDAYEDFVKTGTVRSVTPMPEPGMSFAERIQQRPTGFPSFQKGFADLRYLPEEGGVVFETDLPTFRRGDINPVTGNRIKGRHYAHRVIDPETGKTVTSIPASNIKVYEGTPNWLRGFQQIEGDVGSQLIKMKDADKQLRFIPGNLQKGKFPFKFKQKENLRQNILDWLNKSYAVPGAVGVGAAALGSDEEVPKQQDGGDIPVDPMGYWNPENIGNPVIIPSNDITMEGVDQPLIGISDTGDIQYMEPGEDYEFEGNSVLEIPVAKRGVSVNNADAQPRKKLDQLLNFTNYNKPTAKNGKWLDKYN